MEFLDQILPKHHSKTTKKNQVQAKEKKRGN
jgi:hypothetical protein